jgi:YD repeat-containing protein
MPVARATAATPPYTFSYDADGRLMSEKRDDGVTTTYVYTCK